MRGYARATWHELCALASAARRYRGTFAMDAAWLDLPATFDDRRPRRRSAPVVLVHGSGHNASAWLTLARRLVAAGFDDLQPVGYGLRDDVPAIAERIERVVRARLGSSSDDRVHLVGHSLGGVAARWWSDELGGGDLVDAAVTLGSPHAGTPWARLPSFARGVHDVAPGSALTRQLADRSATYPRWTTIGGTFDVVVPPNRAHLPWSDAFDVPVGHIGLLESPIAGGLVCAALLAAEDLRAAA
jgi:pimeloyl-ACP methyl ester carboxylesterase